MAPDPGLPLVLPTGTTAAGTLIPAPPTPASPGRGTHRISHPDSTYLWLKVSPRQLWLRLAPLPTQPCSKPEATYRGWHHQELQPHPLALSCGAGVPRLETWGVCYNMSLKNIMLNERWLSQKSTYYISHLYEMDSYLILYTKWVKELM